MLQSYLRHWGLGGQPFSLSPDPNMLYLSRQHKECLVRLKYAFYSDKGGALLISENAGEGKTGVVYRLIGDLREELGQGLQVALVDHPSLTPNQMVQEICTQLGVQDPSANRYRNLNQLKEALLRLDGDGMRTLVIVDEGQLLKGRPDTLQELRILLNFVLAGRFLLIGHSLRREQLDYTIVQSAHSDMVRSDQGFHYYQFLRAPGSRSARCREKPAF